MMPIGKESYLQLVNTKSLPFLSFDHRLLSFTQIAHSGSSNGDCDKVAPPSGGCAIAEPPLILAKGDNMDPCYLLLVLAMYRDLCYLFLVLAI